MIYKPLRMHKEEINFTPLSPRLRGLTGKYNETSVRTDSVQ
jgi:hypothetical protein